MAGLSLSDEVIDIYFGHYLRDLDVDSKKRIIAKFVESLVPPPAAPDPEPRVTLAERLEKWGPWEGPFPPEWEKHFNDDEEEVMRNVVSESKTDYKQRDDKEQ